MDERGYVLSGIGMLLIIPVIIMIPIAISVTSQSSNLPNTFVKSDNAFYTNKNIQRDMSLKLSAFRDAIDNNTYNYNSPNQFANNITTLYQTTSTSFYTTTSSSIDSLSITPNYDHGAPQFSSNFSGPINGTIPLKNGIIITYQLDDIDFSTGKYIYNYTIFPTINATILTTKNNTGHNQNYIDTGMSASISIATNTNNPSTAASYVNTFFASVNSLISQYCYT